MALNSPMPSSMRALAAILRLAEALDRSHSQMVSAVELHDRGQDALLQMRTVGDAELELWALARERSYFREVFGRDLLVEEA